MVLLHGLGADARAFQRFERLLPPEWSVSAVNLLGHGDAPKPASGYSLEDHASYVARLLRSLPGMPAAEDPPVLAGHSYGAAVAVATAALYPELIGQLVLLDPIVYRDDPNMESGTEQMIQARRTGRMGPTVDAIFADQSPALRRWIADTWESMSLGVLAEIDHNWMRFAPLVRVPVTIVHGDPERGSGGAETTQFFTGPEVVHIPCAGHFLHATHAHETATAVEAAIKSRATA